MQLKLARLGRKAINCAVLVLGLGLMSAPARAQKHEIGLTLGSIVSQDRTTTEGTKLSLSSATALQANYAYRLGDARFATVAIGAHFLANGSRSISSANETLPRSVATLYLTPDVILKFFPGGGSSRGAPSAGATLSPNPARNCWMALQTEARFGFTVALSCTAAELTSRFGLGWRYAQKFAISIPAALR